MDILLADDQKEIRLLTSQQLVRDGHRITAVANGRDAVEAFRNAPFDIVLLDEHMPELDGTSALRAIRALEKGRTQLVIAVTGYNTDSDRARLLREGFDAVIGKPFRLDSLDATLRDLRASHGPASPPSTANSAGASVADLLRSVGGDAKLALRLARTFLKGLPNQLRRIELAIQRNRPADLAAFAHALKGSVSIFGAPQAQKCCHDLQELGRGNHIGDAARIFADLKEQIAQLEVNLRGYAGQSSVSVAGSKPKRKSAGSSPKRNPR